MVVVESSLLSSCCSTSVSFHLSFMSPWWCPWQQICKLSICTITHRLRAGIRNQPRVMQHELNEAVSDVMLCWGIKNNKSHVWWSCFTSLTGVHPDQTLWSQPHSAATWSAVQRNEEIPAVKMLSWLSYAKFKKAHNSLVFNEYNNSEVRV